MLIIKQSVLLIRRTDATGLGRLTIEFGRGDGGRRDANKWVAFITELRLAVAVLYSSGLRNEAS